MRIRNLYVYLSYKYKKSVNWLCEMIIDEKE